MKKEPITRVFDMTLKLQLVKQLEQGELRVSDVCRIYKVSSTAVYKWLRKYSDLYRAKTRVIVEHKSLSKKHKEQATRIAELERALGQKQMRIDYLEKLMELTGEDVEKKGKRLP